MGSAARLVRHCMALTVAICVLAPIVRTLRAQIIILPTPPRRLPPPLPSRANFFDEDDRSGPRLGVAYLVGGSVTAERAGKHVAPLITLFGWQLEHQFQPDKKDVPVPMTELVLLAGGMEQGIILPSASLLLGMRQRNGWEGAIGPTVTGAGIQLAFAAGVTQSVGRLNIPVNFAVAPGRRGASISVTTGFNMKRGP